MGQNKLPQLTIECKYNNVRAIDILSDLETNYKLKFSFSETLINLNFSYSCSRNSILLEDFLNELFAEQTIDYQYIHKQIVLSPAKPIHYYIIQGFVRDSSSGESLIGVNILDRNKLLGTVSNTHGFYNLKLPEGKHVIGYSYIGYQTYTDTIDLTENSRLDINLVPVTVSLEPIAIEISKQNKLVLSPLSGIDQVDIATLRDLPQLFGETDVLRNLSFLPGVLSKELSSGNLYIRGGNTDHSLFTMDGAPLSEVSHFGGFYSVFNSDIVKHISLHKGSMPASEKGALAAMVDVELREGNKKKWVSTGGISSMSGRVCFEGPIIKDKTSVIISARGSYIDRLINLVNGDPLNVNLFNFSDLNMKVHHRFNQGGTLGLMAYAGDDRIIDAEMLKRRSRVINLRFSRNLGSLVFYESALAYNKTLFSQEIDQTPYAFNLESSTTIAQWKNKFSFYLNSKFKLITGYSIHWQNNRPFSIQPLNDSSIYSNANLYDDRGLEQAVFLESNFSLSNSWQFNLGIRFNHYMLLGPQENYVYSDIDNSITDTLFYVKNEIIHQEFVPEPRLSMRYLLSNQSSLKFAYSQVTQFYHQSTISHIGVRIYRTLPTNVYLPPQKSRNYSMGYYYESTNARINVSAELFYRQMKNITQNHLYPNILETSYPEKYIETVPGSARGAEFSVFSKGKKLVSQLNYTFSQSLINARGINHGNPFPASYDVRHNISVFANYKFNKHWQVSSNWLFQTGLPYTRAVGKYQIDDYQLIQFDHNQINTGRLPSYHRLDLSLSYRPAKRLSNKWQGEWTLSVYNVYFHKNPLGTIYYNNELDTNKPREDWNARFVYFYQFVPAIAYNFNF